MCCSLAPARLSETIIYAGEATRDDKVVHVLGYQNTAQHLGKPFLLSAADLQSLGIRAPEGHDAAMAAAKEVPVATGNAMILPIPALPGTLTPENLVSTKHCPAILSDMARALAPRYRGRLRGSSDMLIGSAKRVQVFEHDIYTVVLADDARDIPSALSLVAEGKRPPLNAAIFEAYAEWYPGWPIAVCCFSNQEASRANPLLWWYEPLDIERLFIPGLDSHSGEAPKRGQVGRDHTVVLGSTRISAGVEVQYSGKPRGEDADLLPNRVIGRKISAHDGRHTPNCDWYARLAAVRAGNVELTTVFPPNHVVD